MRYNEIVKEAVKEPSLFDSIKASLHGKNIGSAYFQVYKTEAGNIQVDWDITFRRNTTEGAFSEYAGTVQSANQKIEDLADQFKDQVMKVDFMTLEKAKASDKFREGNGDDAYSEYEQSMGGGILIKDASIKRKKPKDGRKEYADIAERLTKKFNGKKVGKNLVFTVETRGDSSVTISWKLSFENMRYRAAIEKHEEQIAKAQGLMLDVVKKFNDQVTDLRWYSKKREIELDQYVMPNEVKNKHAITCSVTFSTTLPTNQYIIDQNNQRKAQWVTPAA